jgi:hypothetical protein
MFLFLALLWFLLWFTYSSFAYTSIEYCTMYVSCGRTHQAASNLDEITRTVETSYCKSAYKTIAREWLTLYSKQEKRRLYQLVSST